MTVRGQDHAYSTCVCIVQMHFKLRFFSYLRSSVGVVEGHAEIDGYVITKGGSVPQQPNAAGLVC